MSTQQTMPAAEADVVAVDAETRGAAVRRLLRRHGVVTVLILYGVAVALLFCSRFFNASYGSMSFTWTIITIASFTIVCGAGQGLVVLSGGIDLSIPNVITFCGVLLSQWSGGVDGKVVWVVPLVLAVGFGIGAINGIGITILRLSPVVMTLATNVILGGLALVISDGTPKGGAPPIVKKWMTEQILGGLPLVVVIVVVFVVIAVFVLHRTTFGRAVYAIGTNRTTSFLSGVPVNRTIIVVYALSGLCAALTGVMLVGYAGQAYFGMGDPYLLLSIAAVVVGGAAITGGRGFFLGTVAAAILLTTVTTLLQGTTLPDAVRNMVYAGAIIAAVVAARGTRSTA